MKKMIFFGSLYIMLAMQVLASERGPLRVINPNSQEIHTRKPALNRPTLLIVAVYSSNPIDHIIGTPSLKDEVAHRGSWTPIGEHATNGTPSPKKEPQGRKAFGTREACPVKTPSTKGCSDFPCEHPIQTPSNKDGLPRVTSQELDGFHFVRTGSGIGDEEYVPATPTLIQRAGSYRRLFEDAESVAETTDAISRNGTILRRCSLQQPRLR